MNLDIIQAGVRYSLSDGALCYLLSQDGVGLPYPARISEKGPQQDGDSDRGFLYDPRFVSFVFRLDPPNIWTKRDALLGYFKPRKTAFQLCWTRDDGGVRQLDCHALPPSLATDTRARYLLRVPMQVKANDPIFYDPTTVSVVLGLAAGGDEMEVPLEIPWKVGASVILGSFVVNYPGTYKTFPVIVIHGPIEDCVLTNSATGEKLDFTGTTIIAGDYYTIDLRYARKTVTSAAGVNKIADLTSDSDLATWHIEAAPDAPGGVNPIAMTGLGASAGTQVTMQYHTRYVSL